MLDLKFVRENPDIVKQNIKNKFQDKKIPLVDEVIELDAKNRAAKKEADDLRANKNKIAKQIGALMVFISHEENQSVERMRLHLFPGFFPVRQGMRFVLLQ